MLLFRILNPLTRLRGGVLLGLAAVAAPAVAAPVDFAGDVRPILADACFNCHGFDDASRKAGLRLDLREAAIASRDGAPGAIVPGDAEASELVARILSDDPDEVMPPPGHGVALTGEQKATLRQWVDEGAEYRGHWAFEPLRRPAPPRDDLQPIDAFVAAKLGSRGRAMNAEAPREKLIRRLSYDLTGLPPTPEEVGQFLNDRSDTAYEALVDRLLDSPRYGERMAMWWLDGARYADSHGFQADWERYQWPWRDWVIRAFNDNKPFDDFTVEQIAGDMLPSASTEQIVATGFNRNHRINTEGGSLDAEWLVENVMDRVETVGSVWLGLTLNCARCHNHKYDPISQKEFYQLFAYFHNVPEQGKGPGKQGNFEPVISVPDPERAGEIAALERDIAAARARVDAAEAEARPAPGAAAASPWELAELVIRSEGGARFARQADGSYLASGPSPDLDVFEVELRPGAGEITALLIEALPDPSLVGGSVGRASNGNFVLTGVEVERRGRNEKIAAAAASYEQAKWPVAAAIDGNAKTGWAVDGNTRPKASAAAFHFAEPLQLAAGEVLNLRLSFAAFTKHVIGRPRISFSRTSAPPLPGEVAEPPPVREAKAALAELEKRLAERSRALPTVMVMREMERPRDTFLLERGQYDRRGEQVQPGVPAALPPLPEGEPNNRLGFARWVVADDNPLTARVQVNRIWELLFGRGLVKTSEDFGTQADPPTHPDLLDWLAAEFRDSGWDTKALIKTIVTSDTYRQDSAAAREEFVADPENALLARGPRFRVQAEMVRDGALLVSGLLREKLGGPSVYPYQPDGIWSEFNFYGNLRDYKHATDGNQYRRSLYTIWKRTAAPPGMTLFDMPSREICTVKRSVTNTPLQALALMNDVTYVEAARALAERMVREGGADLRSQLARGFALATSRAATEEELLTLGRGFRRRHEHFKVEPDAARELLAHGVSAPESVADPTYLAALTTVASVLLNLDEAVTKD